MAAHKVSDYTRMHMKVNTAVFMWNNGEDPPSWEKSDLVFVAIRERLNKVAPKVSATLPDAAIWFFRLCCANMTQYALLLIRIAVELSREEFIRCIVTHEQVSSNVVIPIMEEGLYPMIGRWPESRWVNQAVYKLYQIEGNDIEKQTFWDNLLNV